MILVTLVLSAVLAFVCYVYITKRWLANSLTVVMVLSIITSIVFLIKNDHDHFGMHNVTTTKTTRIYSASPSKQMPLMLYKSVGTADKHRVYVYKTSADAKKTSHTTAKLTTHNVVKKTSGRNRIVTQKTYREYRSGAMKFWFGWADNGHQLVKETNTIYLKHNWETLSTTQAKKLQKLAKSKSYQAKQKKAATAYVKKQVTAAMTKDPTMSQAQQQKLTKQATAAYQAKATQQLIQRVKN